MSTEKWTSWIKDIQSYSAIIPKLLDKVITNKDMVSCLFDIFTKTKGTKNEWTERENKCISI